TTLLNLIAGFIRPSRGRVLFDDAPVTGPGPDRGVVFQDANLFPWLTVRENVAFGLRLNGSKKIGVADMTTNYLSMVGMQRHAANYPHMLSGGMKQRVAIARVLALNPRALLMDEPFSSLDANSRERLQDELLRIWQTDRRTLVYVTHSVEEAAYLADRVIIMGPSPNNIIDDIALPLNRPRNRSSAELHDSTMLLRSALDALPCCIKDAYT
ncbi:MAG: ABC transporter ATP-binding protein, partial [Desulfobacterales bacterium]